MSSSVMKRVRKKMKICFVNSHSDLQSIADYLVQNFNVQDPYVFRSAVIEAVQNTVQHSNGRFALVLKKGRIVISNLIKPNGTPKTGIGLQLYSGIFTYKRGSLHHTIIFPDLVSIRELDIDNIMSI